MLKRILPALICLLALCAVCAAQESIVPILDMKIGAVLGGAREGKFQTPGAAVKALKGGEKFLPYGLDGADEGEAAITEIWQPKRTSCPEFYRVSVERPAGTGVLVGTGASWNPAPRLPVTLWSGGGRSAWDNATYVKAVADFLESQGLSNPVVRINQALRVDLEVDGQDEVIIVANHFRRGWPPVEAVRGDYSLVLLRRVEGARVRNILVASDMFSAEVRSGTGFSVREVTAVLDLNGDGRLEIVNYAKYDGGHLVEAYDIGGDRPEVVLLSGCGALN